MNKVINLRQARKQRQRADRRRQGDENAAKSGETAAGRQLREALARQDASRHEGHRITRLPEGGAVDD